MYPIFLPMGGSAFDSLDDNTKNSMLIFLLISLVTTPIVCFVIRKLDENLFFYSLAQWMERIVKRQARRRRKVHKSSQKPSESKKAKLRKIKIRRLK